MKTAVQLHKDGHKVIIVSSGAIGVGLRRMDLEKRPKYLPRIQVSAFLPHRWRSVVLTGSPGFGSNWSMSTYKSMGQFIRPSQATDCPDIAHKK